MTTYPASILENARIATPCSERWDEMTGDDAVRFCGKCEKYVYNVVAMTREAAEALVTGSSRACVRLYRRADGTVLTADCPIGAQRKSATRIAALAVGGGALAAVAGLFGLQAVAAERSVEVGRIVSRPDATAKPRPTSEPPWGFTMGAVAVSPPAPTTSSTVAVPPKPKRHLPVAK
jgi:hypothetical protein